MAQDPRHLLCVEPRFPGRLGAVADWLVKHRGYRVRFYTNALDPSETWPANVGHGIELIQFQVGGVAREPSVPWTRGLERGLCYAYGAWEVFDARRPRPIDVVLGHSCGLGSTLFAPVSYPRVPIVNLFDAYLHPRSNDLADEDAPGLPDEYVHWRRAANAMDLLDLENGVVPWTLSTWQRDLYPPEYRKDFVVISDGVDTTRFRRPAEKPRMLTGRSLPEGTKVVTYVSRRPERLRGFDRFLKLANRLLRERDDVVCVAIGGGPVERMLDIPFHGQDYAAKALADDPPPDPTRLWMLGSVPPATVAEVLGASDLHVVGSRAFPIARSTLEAMAAGAVVLALDTPPTREIITPGRNGLLAASDDPEAVATTALRVLKEPAKYRPLGAAAASLVRDRFDRDACLPRLAAVFDRLLSTDPCEALVL
jgi:glycosyltransferase involved in cell wall biosynthesis